MGKPLTINQFFQKFPNDDACLRHLLHVRYGRNPSCPKCGEIGKFRKLAKMPAYTCNCGHHIHPMAGTPFERSRTPLQKWFYVMFMFTTTRNGVAAKEIQRQLGCTYKTAWRMGHEIRKYMAWVDGDTPLGGPDGPAVEIDKAFIGGKDKMGHDDKTVVLGITERDGGEAIARVVNSRFAWDVAPDILRWVKPRSRVYTDSAKAFQWLGARGMQHEAVNHSIKEYVRGSAHTNTIEAFWMHLKRSIRGTHISVSRKHLQKYLCEFEFRYNLRRQPEAMFPLMMQAFPRP